MVHARKQHLRKYVQTKTFACSIIAARHESKFSKTRAEKRGEGKCLFGIFWVTQSDAAALAFLLLSRRPTSYSALRYKQRRRKRREDRITNEWHVSVCLRLSVRLFASSPPSLSVGHSCPLPFPNSSYPMFWAVKEKNSKYALLAIWSFFSFIKTLIRVHRLMLKQIYMFCAQTLLSPPSFSSPIEKLSDLTFDWRERPMGEEKGSDAFLTSPLLSKSPFSACPSVHVWPPSITRQSYPNFFSPFPPFFGSFGIAREGKQKRFEYLFDFL